MCKTCIIIINGEERETEKNKTSEYYIDKLTMDFLNTVKNRIRPFIDFTVPGIIAHESAMKGGKWLDVPLFDW